MLVILLCVFWILVGYILLKRRNFVKNVNKLPGVDGYPIIGSIGLFWKGPKDQPSNAIVQQILGGFTRLFRKEGLYRLWLGPVPYIILFKAETVEALLSSNTHLKKSQEYDFLSKWLGDGLLTSTGKKWRGRRKLLTPAFHFRILDTVMPMMVEQASTMVKVLGQSQGRPVDISRLSTLCTLDIICESAMGVKVHAQEQPDNEYVRSIHTVGHTLIYRQFKPWLWPALTFNLSPTGRQFYKSLNVLHKFTNQVISERKQTMIEEMKQKQNTLDDGTNDEESGYKRKPLKPFLELMLEMHLTQGLLNESDIREEVDTFMFEGHDTTAMGLTWAFYMIALHSDVQKKVQQEIEEVLGDQPVSELTNDHLKELKYLECVIKESQRLYPSVPFFSRVYQEEAKIGDYLVPAGSIPTVLPYFLHRDPSVFHHPEVFDPERFTPENSRGRHPYAYVPFSAGPRNCIGQKFAIMEEKTVLAVVLHSFNVEALSKRDEIFFLPELVLRPSKPLPLKFTPR